MQSHHQKDKELKMITFVTGNSGKWEIAWDIFAKYGLELSREKIDTPEIQSLSVEEVALYSAKYAAAKLGAAVIKSDVGYYIPALGGFPGPFIKFINQMLSADDLLNLMNGKTDRRLIIKECLALSQPGGDDKVFTYDIIARIADKADGVGSPIDQVMILEGFEKTRGASDNNKVMEYFKQSLKLYHDIAQFLSDKQ
jgi:XTP/dITP diphosphohydrolase